MPTSRLIVTLGLIGNLALLCNCSDESIDVCDHGDCSSSSSSSVSSSMSSSSAATSSNDTDSSSSQTSTSTNSDSGGTLSIDVFGEVGNVYEFTVSVDQAQLMESGGGNPGDGGDEYPPPGGGTYADSLHVIAKNGSQRMYGKTGLRILGESTRRDWKHIPSLKLDVDKFVKDAPPIDKWERLRLHNGQVGGIFREAVALRVWRALGYATPLTNFAWVRSSVWGDDVAVPYTLVENYKRDWCERTLPGGCTNMWEGPGEITDLSGQCQLSSCDDPMLLLLQQLRLPATE